MTAKRVGVPRRQASPFGFCHSFVIRHSSLVICVLALSFVLAACNSSKRLTKANVDEVAEGMSRKQVESILGLPTTVDSKDAQLKRTTYVYVQGKDIEVTGQPIQTEVVPILKAP